VDNYRKLAHVPQPVFAPLDVKSWVHGIGLSLSRQMIRKLNGKISVQSVKGQGSCFVVDI